MSGEKKDNGFNSLGSPLGSNSQSQANGNRITALAAPAASTGANRPIKKIKDPNMTDGRLLVNRRCIYERKLPGNAYVTAHAERLQHGFFSSKNTSDPEIAHVDFLAVNFVMHPGDSGKHRFKSATIKATVQNFPMGPSTENPYPYPQENPKFLMHAPHLIYGAVSPETLQWTFSLAGSLGISETPISASVNPAGTRSASYKVYEMLKIQGSCRTFRSPDGPEFDVEDGEVVWSLSENSLQRSGLPREFTFVMLVQKPSAHNKIMFKIDIDPVIDAWYGKYPAWWINRPSYQPLHKRAINFRAEFGQKFVPVDSEKGFNFATLAQSLDDYVNMPGSTYSSNVSPDGVYNDPNGAAISNPPRSSRPPGGNASDNDSQPIYIPEYPQYPGDRRYQYPTSQPTYCPPFPANAGQVWETNSPFRRGWPRDASYYGEPNGNRESTINVRILLDNAVTSHIAAATLGTPIRRLDSPTMYEINDTPPPNSIRDPAVVKVQTLDTPSKSTVYEGHVNGAKQYTPLTNGVPSTTPPSSGIQRMRNGLAAGSLRRRSTSYAQNGYQNQQNRYSYPIASTDDEPEMF
ncbi:conserved hypothetical protein [Talaromyces stipitatus ATCC 10500]|uniref:Uncharacterized protein n=1 Tax=Talaromyces stipitatus (strain ATCC 10500 / CBS 375.48 / QM 6759 / NRRL 1006) TaxID=441959 RepID=B8LWU4_TALSN|nr:uncharacterized protein TSTA_079320 [Talaromyces stipitatus ATCC 10500]EED24577.1 conserved hypothetical protein [Talaromyces stipitatus ATCC 10500]